MTCDISICGQRSQNGQTLYFLLLNVFVLTTIHIEKETKELGSHIMKKEKFH